MARPSIKTVVADVTIENNMEQIAHKERVIHEASLLQRMAAEMFHQAGVLIQAERASIEALRHDNEALECSRRSQVAA